MGTILPRAGSRLITFGPYINKNLFMNIYSMQNNQEASIHHSGGIIFGLIGRSVLKKFILENTCSVGIVFIDIINGNQFYLKDLSHDAQKMCEHGTNAGGRSEISEAISFESFYGCQGATLEKVSKVWLCLF